MKKSASIAFAAALATAIALPSAVLADEAAGAAPAPTETPAAAETPATPTVEVTAGQMLYDVKGYRVASVYRVTSEGNPQVIIGGRLLTVPASTLSEVEGKLTTSLTKREVTNSN